MKGCGMGEKMERAAIRHTHTHKNLFSYFMLRGEEEEEEKRFK
jgi:S-adenosylmethionine:diacylglycerol 3-amino-3-carboxypropyl transferase